MDFFFILTVNKHKYTHAYLIRQFFATIFCFYRIFIALSCQKKIRAKPVSEAERISRYVESDANFLLKNPDAAERLARHAEKHK